MKPILAPKLSKTQVAVAGPMPMFILDLRNAIRAGKKTQTRRLIVPQPVFEGKECYGDSWKWQRGKDWFSGVTTEQLVGQNGLCYPSRVPYGPVGAIRYLREPIRKDWINGFHFAAFYCDDDKPVLVNGRFLRWRWKSTKLSQMLMPREAARTFCRVEQVRAQRIQEISAYDAMCEGVGRGAKSCDIIPAHYKPLVMSAFKALWDSINAKCGHGWDKNEWVFAYTFGVVQ